MRVRKAILLAISSLFLLVLSYQPALAQSKLQQELHQGWKFHEAGKQIWYPATVPGCVHVDLMNNNVIGDPFYRDNEQTLQWIGKTDWEYETVFQVPAEILSRQNIELVFEGLDTYARAYLNGVLVIEADNMFREWRAGCKSLLRPSDNDLRVYFRSPIQEILPIMGKLAYQLPAVNDQGEKTSPFTRKAPYHYGWDWGPRFVTSGIWRPVRLEAWDDVKIADVFIVQEEIKKDLARLSARIEVPNLKVSCTERRPRTRISEELCSSTITIVLEDESGSIEPVKQEFKTIETYALPEDRDIQSPVMQAHQKHPRGNQLIREYMLRDYPEPKDFASFLYVSQVLQAEGIKIGAEHLRRIMPRNMGSLFWQINDCWPVASWSSIDYFGRWKALQYYARRFYGDILISPHEENGGIQVYVVSDRVETTPADLDVSLMDFSGNVLEGRSLSISVAGPTSGKPLTLSRQELLKNRDAKSVFLLCELRVAGKIVSSNSYFFDAMKNLALPRPAIELEVTPLEIGFRISLVSDKLARNVYLSLDSAEGWFSDNYFDLIPGRKVEVDLVPLSAMDPNVVRENLRVVSLVDAAR